MLKQKLKELVSACFTGIWVETFEFQEAIREIADLCREEEWIGATWDIGSGLRVGNGEPVEEATDPLAAIGALKALASPEGTVLLVMNNLHKFVSSIEIMQALQHQLIEGKQNRTIIIGLSPIATIPMELEKMFVVVEHALPNHEQLEAIAREVATEEEELPDIDTTGPSTSRRGRKPKIPVPIPVPIPAKTTGFAPSSARKTTRGKGKAIRGSTRGRGGKTSNRG